MPYSDRLTSSIRSRYLFLFSHLLLILFMGYVRDRAREVNANSTDVFYSNSRMRGLVAFSSHEGLFDGFTWTWFTWDRIRRVERLLLSKINKFLFQCINSQAWLFNFKL